MKRLAVLALVVILAACGSDNNGPNDAFTGTWTGTTTDNADTLHFTFISAQSGSAFSGTGTVAGSAASAIVTFNGTSTPPTIIMTMEIQSQSLAYSGTFVTDDSIVGTLAQGAAHSALDLKKN